MSKLQRLRNDEYYDMEYNSGIRGLPMLQRQNIPAFVIAVSLPLTVFMVMLTILIKIYAEYLFGLAFLTSAVVIISGGISAPIYLFMRLKRYHTQVTPIDIGPHGTILEYDGKQLQIISNSEIYATETEPKQNNRLPLPLPSNVAIRPEPLLLASTYDDLDSTQTTQPLPEPARPLDASSVEEAINASLTEDAVAKLKVEKAKHDAQVQKVKQLIGAGLSFALVKSMVGIKKHEDFVELCHEAGIDIGQ